MAARKKWRRIVRSRPLVQVSALILSNAYILSALRFIPCSWLQCSNCAASTFACPLILIQRGAVMASMGMIGGLSSKFTGSAAAAMAMLVLFAAIGGAFACAWLCPFGFLQDLLAKIPVKKFTLPAWSGILRLPVFFGLVIAVPYLTRSLAFCDLCPRKINPVRTPSHSQCDRCLRCTTACENITADLRL